MSDPIWDYAKSVGAENVDIKDPPKLFRFLCRHFELYNKLSDERTIKKIMKGIREIYSETGNLDRSVIMAATFRHFDKGLKWDLEHIAFCRSRNFYQSSRWKNLRLRMLERQHKCMACGRSPQKDDVVLHVDHVLPRSIYPEYAMNIENLQVLCADCNIGKGNTRTKKF